jgi:hypothetical protein
MTKRTLRTKSVRRKHAAKSRALPREARGKKAASAPTTPEPVTFRDMVHEAMDGVEAARRAFDDMRVYAFRGKYDLAQYEDIAFLESLQRVRKALVTLDLEVPEGGES